MVTKVRSGTVRDVSNIAFKIVKPLLDDLISGEIKWDDLIQMRIKNIKDQKKEPCEKSENNISSQENLDTHEDVHEGKCRTGDLCGCPFIGYKKLKKHGKGEHSGDGSPDVLRLREEEPKSET